ncbi:MAG: PASTA domain-containing protein [Oscillospiraceae bacterium]|nr:PASTA domain-containing protein [Oscillospiraceae bacterium]MCI1990935.1 PASTA domain-containing protein [Oscillospiraceae bacterium]MCI2035880.1 PASTA domain-containing protein [Oscillospiraceae bacterium]
MAGIENLCMNCMSGMQGQEVCPVCGRRKDEPQMPGALPFRTVLQNRYAVGRAKKSNGEGVTYIGYDNVLNIPVELHEYFPASLSERAEDGRTVRVLGGSELAFQENRKAFLEYSRAIAHMRELSSILVIYDIFEENNAAYTVSEWNDSITLRYFVERSGGSLGWNAARQLFMPVLSSLSVLHAHSVGHFGISPDTLQIMKDGKMKLGGFSIGAVRQMDTDLPPDLIPGCASVEQYIMGDTLTEATDVYGFAASLFFTLTGTLPPEAPKRRTDARLLIPNAILRSLPPYIISALANALQLSPEKRTPTFERLRAELSAAPAVTAALETSQKFARVPPARPVASPEQPKAKKGVPGVVWVLSSCLTMLVIFVAIGMIWMNRSGADSQMNAAQTAASEMSAETAASQPESDLSDANTVLVPNLVGENYADLASAESAEDSAVREYQVLPSNQPSFSDSVPEGCILSQDPKPGTRMKKGTVIVVVVSKGPAVRTLPKVAGKTLSEASAAVTSAGLVPSQTEENSDTVPEGRVIGYQDVQEGSQMAYGSKVILVVSAGPRAAEPSSAASAR